MGRAELAADLERWWMDVAHDEATAVVGKAVEYGSNSMTELGRDIAKLAGRQVTDQQAIELACYFYIKGKMGRWSDAIVAGRGVSDDTLGDIGVYVRMAQRVRSNGGWPGKPQEGISEASDGISGGLKTGPGVLAPIRRSEATEDPTTCPECGYARDTANHEYGCKGDRA